MLMSLPAYTAFAYAYVYAYAYAIVKTRLSWAKTIAFHTLYVYFLLLSISLPSSAKQGREIAKFEVLGRTSALEDKFSFSFLN